jgi:hypothetical protein
MKLSPTKIRPIRLVGLLLAIAIVFTVGCSTPDPIVGNWKPEQRYDRFHEAWEPAKDEVYLEFSPDGKYSGFTKGKLSRGTYKVDSSTVPHTLIFNDDKSGPMNSVFKVEGNNLTMKSYVGAGADFPENLEPASGEPAFELVILKRQ